MQQKSRHRTSRRDWFGYTPAAGRPWGAGWSFREAESGALSGAAVKLQYSHFSGAHPPSQRIERRGRNDSTTAFVANNVNFKLRTFG